MRSIVFLSLLFWCHVLAGQTFYHTGNDEPVSTDHLPGIVLAGGAGDNDEAMQWMLGRADGGDVVVLRANHSDGYNPYFYGELDVDINAVTTIVIESKEHANDPDVIETVSHAEVVFMAGGNQWNYVSDWRDTQLLETLNQLIHEKGITIGGTSAGMAVLGEVVFTAENNTVWSSEALGNPYHWRVKLEKDFLDVPFMEHTVTDSHYNRIHDDDMDRHGRHVVFMARMATDWDMPSRGIAANEYTAIAVDEEGIARVFGEPGYDDYGYFLQRDGGPPEICEDGEPLTWDRDQQAVRVYKIKGDFEGSGWFNLANWWEGDGGEWQHWYVTDGELDKNDADYTGLNDLSGNMPELTLFPSPASDRLTVIVTPGAMDFAAAVPVTLTVLSMDGQALQQQQFDALPDQPVSLDVGDLPSGLYVLQLATERHKMVRLWVKD